MLARVRSTLLGLFVLTLAVIFTAVVCLPIYLLILIKLALPHWQRRQEVTDLITRITTIWTYGMVVIQTLFLPTRWEIEWPTGLDPEESYLVVVNHQSWVDILAYFQALTGLIPFPRFFLKRQLLWMPLIGPVFWGLDFPAMRRHSREYLQQHPEQRGHDLETVRQMCRRYQGRPVSIINFLEGTRFRPTKHATQASPYSHLLKPRAGGAAFALSAMEGTLRQLVDLTIAYPEGNSSFLSYLGGQVPLIRMRVRCELIPEDLLHGDYLEDDDYRARFQEWVQKLWERKDRDLDEMLEKT